MSRKDQKRTYSDDPDIPESLELDEKFAFCIGHLMGSWGVAESLVRGIFMCVTTPHNVTHGEIIWFGIKNTRAKVDLLRRCTRHSTISTGYKDSIFEILSRFETVTATRNFYAHCAYNTDPDTMRLASFSGYEFGEDEAAFKEKTRPANHNALNGLRQTIKSCNELARDVLPFLHRLKDECGVQHLVLPEPPAAYPTSTKYHPQ